MREEGLYVREGAHRCEFPYGRPEVGILASGAQETLLVPSRNYVFAVSGKGEEVAARPQGEIQTLLARQGAKK